MHARSPRVEQHGGRHPAVHRHRDDDPPDTSLKGFIRHLVALHLLVISGSTGCLFLRQRLDSPFPERLRRRGALISPQVLVGESPATFPLRLARNNKGRGQQRREKGRSPDSAAPPFLPATRGEPSAAPHVFTSWSRSMTLPCPMNTRLTSMLP